MANRIEYEAAMRSQASRKTEFKWARNITGTFFAGLAVSFVTSGKVNRLTLLLTWGFAALYFVAWESVAYGYRRFYVAPFDEHQRQASVIEGLEKELTVARAERMTSDKRRELAGLLRHQSEIAVNNYWAKPPQKDEDIQPWIEGIRGWHNQTLEIMKTKGCTEAEIGSVRALGNLAEFNPTGIRYSWDGTVNTWLTMLDGYRQRLEIVIRRYDG